MVINTFSINFSQIKSVQYFKFFLNSFATNKAHLFASEFSFFYTDESAPLFLLFKNNFGEAGNVEFNETWYYSSFPFCQETNSCVCVCVCLCGWEEGGAWCLDCAHILVWSDDKRTIEKTNVTTIFDEQRNTLSKRQFWSPRLNNVGANMLFGAFFQRHYTLLYN